MDIQIIAEERWYLPVEDRCTLFVRERGSGEPIVVLHGGPGHSHDLLLGAFVRLEAEHRFVYYDQRGTFYSPFETSLISFAANINDLEVLRKELAIDQLTLLAHSAGSLLAMGYIEQFPDRVANAILVGSPAFRYPKQDEEDLGDPVIQSDEFDQLIMEKTQRQLKLEGLPQTIDQQSLASLSAKEKSNVASVYFAANFLHDVGRWRNLRGGGVFYNQTTAKRTHDTMPETWDYAESLGNFKGRITVINGRDDYRINGNLWRNIREEIPHLEYVEIAEAGHAIWIDQPNAFESAVRDALRTSE